MKLKTKSKIIILSAFGILFALLPIITSNLIFNAGNNKTSLENDDDINLDYENLKISAISGKIHIINNSGWVTFKNDGNCTGEGTYSDPYIIEDLVINGGGSGSCILIENSDVYFKIENCTVYGSGVSTSYAGIRLLNVNNSQIIMNVCWPNYIGIYLGNSYNNTISGNAANDNSYGIRLYHSNNNTISGNTANNNTRYGIILISSDYNTISGNTANNNSDGIYLSYSDYNTISGNTANNNDRGICLYSSNNNMISGNTANNNDRGIYLSSSDDNTVSGNIANNNGESGIYLVGSAYNTISGNTANNNSHGIDLYYSGYNTISGNTANDNYYGIYLIHSNYSIVSGNTLLGNDECIVEHNCEGNIFENNDCGEGDGISFELIILITCISGGAVIGIATLLKCFLDAKGKKKMAKIK